LTPWLGPMSETSAALALLAKEWAVSEMTSNFR
jgi:hypothetical protein